MRFGGLQIFSKTNTRRDWIIASWHSPHSLTWRWCLSFKLGDNGARFGKVWMPFRNNNGLQWMVRLPFVGLLRFAQQRPMWYRDMWARKRDEDDGLADPWYDQAAQTHEAPKVLQ